MPQRCTVCSHPKRDDISRKLLDPGAGLAALSEAYGLSTSALDRHRQNHLKVSTGLVSEAKNALTVVAYASDLFDRSVRLLDAAEAGLDGTPRSVQAAAASVREVRQSIELLARLVVTGPQPEAEAKNAWLDEQITAAVDRLALPALSAGPSEVEEATIVKTP
jgi:hypothetical protein